MGLSRKKILYIDPFNLPDQLGGSQKSLLDIMCNRKARGEIVTLAMPGEGMLTETASRHGIELKYFFLPKLQNTRITIGGNKVFNVFAMIYNFIILLMSAFSILSVLKQVKPDLVHTNQMLISISSGLACTVANVPCIWHIRENPAKHIPVFVLKSFGILGSLFSDRILVNSKYTADIFKSTSLYKKITIVPVGINTSAFHSNYSMEFSVVRQPKSKKVISIVGRIIPMKGHKDVINAIKILKDKDLEVVLNIIGHINEDDKYYLSLKSLIEGLDIATNVKFCGFVSDTTPIYHTSDIIVSASTETESFGRTIIEAMAASKPVVATRVGAHPEIIEDGVTGFLIDPNNPYQMAGKFYLLLTQNQLAQQIGLQGLSKFNKYFSLDQYCNKIEASYNQVMSDK